MNGRTTISYEEEIITKEKKINRLTSKDFENLRYGYSIAWWNSAKYSFKLIIQALIYILIINYASVMEHCQNWDQSNSLVQLPLHHQSAFSVWGIFNGNWKEALIKHFSDFIHFVMIKKFGSVIWCLTLLLYISKKLLELEGIMSVKKVYVSTDCFLMAVLPISTFPSLDFW